MVMPLAGRSLAPMASESSPLHVITLLAFGMHRPATRCSRHCATMAGCCRPGSAPTASELSPPLRTALRVFGTRRMGNPLLGHYDMPPEFLQQNSVRMANALLPRHGTAQRGY